MKIMTIALAALALIVLAGCSTIAERAADITNKACKDMSQVERAAFESRVNDALADTGNTFNGITCAGD